MIAGTKVRVALQPMWHPKGAKVAHEGEVGVVIAEDILNQRILVEFPNKERILYQKTQLASY